MTSQTQIGSQPRTTNLLTRRGFEDLQREKKAAIVFWTSTLTGTKLTITSLRRGKNSHNQENVL
jgi:hypothetical protein